MHRGVPADILPRLLGGRVGVPLGFPDIGIEVIEDDGLTIAELDTLDAVVTGSALAIADTGTIVLDCGPHSGRRALTLVPDHHVCIVESRAIVPSVPDAVARLAEAARPAAHVRLRPFGHVGHRARPCRGRPRPARPRRDRHERHLIFFERCQA